MQVLKQRFARTVLTKERKRKSPAQAAFWNDALDAGHVWQRRFYDFVVWSEHKRIEKLRYMHRNPVKRGLVLEPDQWRWSSFRYYACEERGSVLVNTASCRVEDKESGKVCCIAFAAHPSKTAKGGAASVG